MKRAVPLVVFVAACTPTRVEPTGAEGAEYFGLVDQREVVYLRGDGAVEIHTIQRSTEFEASRFVWDVVARVNGFVVDAGERTMRLETTESELLLLRENDCNPTCEVLANPVKLLEWPLETGATQEAEVDVEVSRGAEVLADQARSERHATQVGEQAEVMPPADTFTAFEVAWTRTRTLASGGEPVVENATIHVAPDVGVVIWDGFDGAHLEIDEAP